MNPINTSFLKDILFISNDHAKRYILSTTELLTGGQNATLFCENLKERNA